MFGKSLATNRRGLQLLIDTLAPLVPYESAEYMKVGIVNLIGVNLLSQEFAGSPGYLVKQVGTVTNCSC